MSTVIDKSAPFAHGGNSVQRTMGLVLAALLPATLFNIGLFGWPALFLFLITVLSCMAFEAASLRMAGKPLQPSLNDGSAVLTGWLLAMSLPPWAPWWIGVAGALLAIVFAKHMFGGIGQNPFNPAMVARVGLLISFPVPMTLFVAPKPLFSDGAPGFLDGLSITFGKGFDVDALSAASALGQIKIDLTKHIPVRETLAHGYGYLDLALGTVPGSLGETSAALILAGGLFLLVKRVISWHIPVSLIGTLFVIATLANLIDPARYPDGLFHILSGATFLGAFFIATDYVTSPVSKEGQLAYGAGCALLTWIIRTYAGYPEGMAFAVLLMNAITPLLDRYMRPRVFGRTRQGAPLPVKEVK